MPAKSELHLIVPGICGPLAETESLKASPVIASWIKTLSRSSCSSSSDSVEKVIATLFKLTIKNDFPSAALTLLANDVYDPARFYMHADPVHLQADIDSALLRPGADLAISADEAEDFCDTLSQHFDIDGLTFLVLKNDQWFVSCENKINMKTTSLSYATGRNINFLLPEGDDAVRWKQILTEAQMLMYAHKLNATREETGRMNVNSLWFHGAGELADIKSTEVHHLCSNHDVMKGLARCLKLGHSAVPDSVNAYTDYLLSCEPGTSHVLHLDALEHLVTYTDVEPWLDQLTQMLDDWIYPLIRFANKNNIRLTLYPCNEKKYQFSKHDGLKFWRNDPLEKHVNCY